MRDIKFRTWIIPTKRMAIVTGLCYQSKGVGVEILRPTGKNVDDPAHQEFWWIDKEAILMQYIGEKDKNGEEIWEGDIGRYPYDEKIIWCVRYRSGEFQLIGDFNGDLDVITNYRYIGDWNCMDDPEYTNWQLFEKIGNFYENPELVKGKL